MKNSLGSSVIVTLFGESHGAELGVVIDGLAPGILVDEAFIAHQLDLRRPQGNISTARHEADTFRIVSGVFQGKTTGTPLALLIPNESQHSKDYAATRALARPGHADYTAFAKYHGFEDYRGGGHFSGRVTAPLVAAGAICLQALASKGIFIGTHIAQLGSVRDAAFAGEEGALKQQLIELDQRIFATLCEEAAEAMRAEIEAAAAAHNSVGGVLETAVVGMPAGVGEPWFDSLESVLSHGLFSIPAVKGVEFGAGFDLACSTGSTFNDAFRMEGSRVVTTTNNNGGINGGISNGMPLLMRCAVKPTPSIFQPQQTVDFMSGQNATLEIQGRHDPAIIHRARVVVDSVVALVLCDMLALRYGTDWLAPDGEGEGAGAAGTSAGGRDDGAAGAGVGAGTSYPSEQE